MHTKGGKGLRSEELWFGHVKNRCIFNFSNNATTYRMIIFLFVKYCQVVVLIVFWVPKNLASNIWYFSVTLNEGLEGETVCISIICPPTSSAPTTAFALHTVFLQALFQRMAFDDSHRRRVTMLQSFPENIDLQVQGYNKLSNNFSNMWLYLWS